MFLTMGTPPGSPSGICGILTQPMQPLKTRLAGVTNSPGLQNALSKGELERARQIVSNGSPAGASRRPGSLLLRVAVTSLGLLLAVSAWY
jgi:hypothetical protein